MATNKGEGTLLKGMFLKTWLVSTIGMSLAMINAVVDGVIIGRFLGEDAIAALGLTMPVILMGSMLATLISQGTVVLCSKYIGMADKRRLCEVFSTSCIFALIFSLPIIALGYAFTPNIAAFFCGYNEIYAPLMADYLYGFLPIFCLNCFIIMGSGLMRLDNDFKRGLVASTVFTCFNILFDFVSVTLNGGLFGIALAGTIAAYISFLILLAHFFKKDVLLHFSFKFWHPSHIISVLKLGFSTTVGSVSVLIRTFTLNRILLYFMLPGAVAAYSIIQSLAMFFALVIMAIAITISMIAGTMHGEGDRKGLQDLFKLTMTVGGKLSLTLSLIIIIFAEPLAAMYVTNQDGETLSMATSGLRFFALSLPFMMVKNSMAGYYLSFGRIKENYLITFLSDCLFPILFAWLFYPILGVNSVWGCFVVGAAGGCLIVPIFAWLHYGKRIHGFNDLLLLNKDFGADTENIYEASVHSLEEAVRASEEARQFCLKKGEASKTATAIALCIEELTKNVLAYGFRPDGKNHVEIRLLCEKDSRTLRIRDDCRPFDPVKWFKMNHSEDLTSALGIRMVMAMAKDVKYMPMLGINQLIIKI